MLWLCNPPRDIATLALQLFHFMHNCHIHMHTHNIYISVFTCINIEMIILHELVGNKLRSVVKDFVVWSESLKFWMVDEDFLSSFLKVTNIGVVGQF